MEESTQLVAIVVAVIVVIATILFFVLRKVLTGRGNTVLLVGLSDSGKTRIFSRLVNNNNEPITYTSLVENVFEDWKVGDKNLRLVDFPGADRMRKQLVDNWLRKERNALAGIVFVIDSASFGKKARDVAALFYDVALESGKTRILFACNKQDLGLAKSSQVVRSGLEKEVGLINRSREAALDSTEGSANNHILTSTGENFSWDDLNRQVDFVESAAVEHEQFSLDPILEWL